MKPHINKLVQIVSKNILPDGQVVEIGSFQVAGQEQYANLRPYFRGKEYLGCDMRHGKGVDKIENIEKLSFASNSVGTLLCLETLEHVWDTFKAASETVRVLKPGGLLILNTVFAHPIHEHPSDYWRFTPESINSLFKALSPRLVGWEGELDNPHSVFIVGYKHGSVSDQNLLDSIAQKYNQYINSQQPDSIRLQLRKWRHEPLKQLRKSLAPKNQFNYVIYR